MTRRLVREWRPIYWTESVLVGWWRNRRCLICSQWPVGWAMPGWLIHRHLRRMADHPD